MAGRGSMRFYKTISQKTIRGFDGSALFVLEIYLDPVADILLKVSVPECIVVPMIDVFWEIRSEPHILICRDRGRKCSGFYIDSRIAVVDDFTQELSRFKIVEPCAEILRGGGVGRIGLPVQRIDAFRPFHKNETADC